jgi:hypothetical protein
MMNRSLGKKKFLIFFIFLAFERDTKKLQGYA